MPDQSRAIGDLAGRPSRKAVGLDRGVALGRHPAVAAFPVVDIGGAPTRHPLEDRAAVTDHDLRSGKRRGGVRRVPGWGPQPHKLDAGLGAGALDHREAIGVGVVAEQEGAAGDLGQRPARGKALDVNRLAHPDDLERRGKAAHAPRNPVVERDNSPHHAGQLGWRLQVELAAVGDEQLWSRRVETGELVGDPDILDQRRVEAIRESRLIDDLDPALLGGRGAIARFGGEDNRLVAEPVELLGDGEQIGLAATEAEMVGGEQDPHPALILGSAQSR